RQLDDLSLLAFELVSGFLDGLPERPFKEAAALALFSMAEGNAVNRQAILELTAGGVVPLAEQLSRWS
ncbi:hypothetical protein WJX84_010536, partial [Apatococcus fuscideae]